MFLGVSGNVPLVNEDDRKQLGKLIAAQRKTQYGTKSAAYKEASVNSATWDRAEAGESVREDRLQAIVRLLWPSTGGDAEKALARGSSEWANWEDRTTPLAYDESDADRITSWAAEHFERINHALAEMADTIEALSRKVENDGTQTSPQKTLDIPVTEAQDYDPDVPATKPPDDLEGSP
ncbi:MAG: hypothetical protein JWM76_4210 [Pseudonocardiales bacterium]|nr:hypothetical protein [Pseudonocardiales bacterium]